LAAGALQSPQLAPKLGDAPIHIVDLRAGRVAERLAIEGGNFLLR
jgi:hypothetical protein